MRLPIKVLKEIGKKYGYSVVVIYAFDDTKAIQHIASWGKSIYLCDKAAQWADKLKDALGWPESLHAMPSRVKKLNDENERLRELLKEAYELSTWAACMNFDGRANEKEWCDGLYEKIENFQKHYEEFDHDKNNN